MDPGVRQRRHARGDASQTAAGGRALRFLRRPVAPEHDHLIELAARRILCTCRPCHIVFEPAGAAQGKYRAIPNRYREVAEFVVDDATWDSLQLPIGLVFFFYNSTERRTVAFYPSPAGATESLLPLEAMGRHRRALSGVLVDRTRRRGDSNPAQSRSLALLHRARSTPRTSSSGLIRTCWKGFDGGQEAHQKIAQYFEKVRTRSGSKITARIS